MGLTDAQRELIDARIDRAVEALPSDLRRLLDEVPLIVLDRPTIGMLREMGVADSEEGGRIAGLHTGIARTERSIEHSGELPGQIHIFREGVLHMAGGWPAQVDEAFLAALDEEIRITLLHEIGHEMGLDEDDLEALGYD